jgi:hypothetical protein
MQNEPKIEFFSMQENATYFFDLERNLIGSIENKDIDLEEAEKKLLENGVKDLWETVK